MQTIILNNAFIYGRTEGTRDKFKELGGGVALNRLPWQSEGSNLNLLDACPAFKPV